MACKAGRSVCFAPSILGQYFLRAFLFDKVYIPLVFSITFFWLLYSKAPACPSPFRDFVDCNMLHVVYLPSLTYLLCHGSVSQEHGPSETATSALESAKHVAGIGSATGVFAQPSESDRIRELESIVLGKYDQESKSRLFCHGIKPHPTKKSSSLPTRPSQGQL